MSVSKNAAVSMSIDPAMVEGLKKDKLYLSKKVDEQENSIKEKEEKIDKQKLVIIELELAINELRKKDKDLQLELDQTKERNIELEEVVRLNIRKEGFVPASQTMSSPAVALWIAAVNVNGFAESLLRTYYQLNPKQMNGKIVFNVTEDGQLGMPHAE